MKQLLLVRHAKSSWSDFSIQDFDRPLTERGKADALLMAQKLLDKNIVIDALISSTAKRAKKTASQFAKKFGYDKEAILLVDELYLASPAVFFEVIGRTKNEYNTIAVFSHNNGITDFANVLTETKIDEIPTCGIFAIKIKTDDWKLFKEAEKEFWFFDSPKI